MQLIFTLADCQKEGKESAQLSFFAENSTDICPLKSCKNLANLLGNMAMTYFLSGD